MSFLEKLHPIKTMLLLCFILISNLFAQVDVKDKIGRLTIPKEILNQNDRFGFGFKPNRELNKVNITIREENGTCNIKENRTKIKATEEVNLSVAYKDLDPKKTEFEISPFIENKNKTASILDVTITALSNDNEELFFGEKLVVEYLNNNQIKIWHFIDYLNSNGSEKGVLAYFSSGLNENKSGKKVDAKVVNQKEQFKKLSLQGSENLSTNYVPGGSINSIASTISTTVWGYVYYMDSNGNRHPFRYGEVNVWEADNGSAYHSFDWVGLTDGNGYFSIPVTHDDGDNNLELYLEVGSINSWISVELYQPSRTGYGLESIGEEFTWTGPVVSNVTASSVQIDCIINDDRKGAAQIFDWLMTAAEFTRSAFDLGQVQAVWPGSGGSYTAPNYNYNIVIDGPSSNSNYPDVALHEFGHSTMYRRNNYTAPNSSGSHSFLKLYSPGLAWSEGWATAYSQFVMNDGYYDASNFAPIRPHIENARLGYGNNIDYYPPNSADNTSHNEVWAAAAILDLYDSGEPDNGDDLANSVISFSEMMQIIGSNNINSIIDFYNIIKNNYLTELEKHYASRAMVYNKFNVPIYYPNPPVTPQNLTVNEKDESYPILTWEHNSQGSDYWTGFRIYRCVTIYSDDVPENFVPIATVGKDVNTYSDLQVTNGGWNYAYYKVKTINEIAESDFSNQGRASLITLLNKKGENANNSKPDVVSAYEVRQNYPNPFNPTTNISYSVKENGFVSLQVFNVLGNKIADLVNEIKPAGEYSISFDGSNLPSGIYIYKYQCGNHVDIRKMTLMK